MVHFKDHHVFDLSVPIEQVVSSKRRRLAKKAWDELELEFSEEPSRHLDEWCDLFDEFAARLGLKGIKALSRSAFEEQFGIPGVTMTLARHAGRLVAARVQCYDRDVVHAYLAAASPESYRLNAAAALYYAEIEIFRERAKWINWGGDAGARPGHTRLSSFKRGWSTGTRPAYFYGRVTDRQRYVALSAAVDSDTSFFPAYRSGEFS